MSKGKQKDEPLRTTEDEMQRTTEDEMQPKLGPRDCGLCLRSCVLPSRGAIATISLIGTGFGVATHSSRSPCARLVIISSIAAWPAVLYSLRTQWLASGSTSTHRDTVLPWAHVSIHIREKRCAWRWHVPLCLNVRACVHLAANVGMPSCVVCCILAPATSSL